MNYFFIKGSIKIRKNYQKLIKKLPVFMPNNRIFMLLDIVLVCVIYLNFILIPFNIGFDISFNVKNNYPSTNAE